MRFANALGSGVPQIGPYGLSARLCLRIRRDYRRPLGFVVSGWCGKTESILRGRQALPRLRGRVHRGIIPPPELANTPAAAHRDLN